MLFSSSLFLFLFFPIVLLLFYFTNRKFRNTILLLASLFFYLWGEPRFLPIAILSAIVDYFLCHAIYANKNDNKKAKNYLILGIILNVSLLFYYKYLDFFLANLNYLLVKIHFSSLPLLHLLLPIGVSFIVFEKITYLVDVYRGQGKPAPSLHLYLLYIFLFPKLLAGPIVKYHDIELQLKDHLVRQNDIIQGFKRFLIGLMKKVLLADTVGELANTVFNFQKDQLGFSQAWLGIICFTLQIYLDFSSYSDMAIGLARMFGFNLLENFNMPYTALSFTDFWRRWHISLSTWIKEYLYYSLGGNRKNQVRTYLNLWICFLISGLWHGARWNFLFWGAYHGFFLILDKLFWLRLSAKLPHLFRVSITLFFIICGWVIFRSQSLSQVFVFFSAMFDPFKQGQFLYITDNIWFAMFAGIFISFIQLAALYEKAIPLLSKFRWNLLIENWVMSILVIFTIVRVMSMSFNSFLYFRF